MGHVVNLHRVRKKKVRAAKEAKAAENRLVHGRPKGDRERDRATKEKMRLVHEGHRIDKGEQG